MKILEICTVDFSLTGIPIHIRNYYNQLKKNNRIDIIAKSFDKKILSTMPKENGTKLYELPRTKKPFQYVKKLQRIVKQNNYDVIHIHGNSATMSLELFACRKSSALKIVHTHNTNYEAKVLNKLLKSYLYHNANLFFAASHEAGKHLYGNRKFTIIENGIDSGKFRFNSKSKVELFDKYKLPKNKIILGHVGTFNEQKNQQFLVELSKKLNPEEYHFILIGDGQREEFMSNLSNRKMFTILPTSSTIEKFYSAFDIFLFPSKWEGLGMAAIEAQYSGLPTLVSSMVPKEAKISSNIKYLPLNLNKWIETIELVRKSKKMYKRDQVQVSSKYDIHHCSNKLMKLYKKNCNAKNK